MIFHIRYVHGRYHSSASFQTRRPHIHRIFTTPRPMIQQFNIGIYIYTPTLFFNLSIYFLNIRKFSHGVFRDLPPWVFSLPQPRSREVFPLLVCRIRREEIFAGLIYFWSMKAMAKFSRIFCPENFPSIFDVLKNPWQVLIYVHSQNRGNLFAPAKHFQENCNPPLERTPVKPPSPV